MTAKVTTDASDSTSGPDPVVTQRLEHFLHRLEELAKRRYVSPYDMGVVLLALGDEDRALVQLNEAYRQRSSGLIFLREIPAIWFLGVWIGLQLWLGGLGLTQPDQSGGVAFFARIGGFAFGVLTVRLVAKRQPLRPVY